MLRAIAASGILGCTALTAGCADLMQQSYISQIAPEWFEAKAVEVKGEGYPELADVPEVRKAESTLAQSDEGATRSKIYPATLAGYSNSACSTRSARLRAAGP